jgi:prepilin-type N-terminal cleavage/methylation domain-containing protein
MKSTRHAFTLVELLVVISIILVASSIIFIGGSGGDGAKLSSSQRIVSGIAQGARGQAILKNARARLIIYSEDPANPDDEKKLRFFGVVYEDSENPGQWFAGTQGTYLPEGIYFDPNGSPDAGNNPWPLGSSTMNLEFPRLSSQPTGGPEYYFYEFNANGTMATGFENSWLVLRAGNLRPDDSGNLSVDFPAAGDADDPRLNLKSALIFRRVGTTTMVSDPADIN